METKKKLVLTTETLVNLSLKSGIKTGIGNGGPTILGSVCTLATHNVKCVFPK